ncbi:MAG: hypothetical protein L0323_22440 [Planctomycetes bacterium]|nr:hypothetical protein [Planctomycetota bacterium]
MNAEQGDDSCFDGLNPIPSVELPCPIPYPPAPPPPPPYAGPFKTITRALSVLGTAGYAGPPFTVWIAGRRDNVTTAPIPYDAANGEVFPLSVMIPQVTLRYDAARSDRAPLGGLTSAIIEGPDPVNSQTETLHFMGVPANLGTCGIDGSGGSPYGFEIRGGEVSVIFHTDGATGGMNASVRGVLFSGAPAGSTTESGNALNVHVLNGAQATVLIDTCRFTTALSIPFAPVFPGGSPFNLGGGQRAAFILLFENQTGAPPPVNARLDASIRSITMEPDPTVTPVPEVVTGIELRAWTLSEINVAINDAVILGHATATTPPREGIGTGIRLTVDNGSPTFALTGSEVSSCGEYGVHVRPEPQFSVSGILPALTIDTSVFTGNGVRGPAPSGCANGTGGQCLPGAAIAVELQAQSAGTNSSVGGSIASNVISGNRVGIILTWNQNTLPTGTTTYPQGLSISGNDISSQTLNPPLTDPSPGIGTYSGIGLLMLAENGAFVDDPVVVDSNRIHDNEGRGVLMVIRSTANGPATLSPRLQNNLIYSNGTLAGSLEDGVEVWNLGGGTIRPRLVYNTIWGNGLFGVNNVVPSAASRPEIYRSIIWRNNGPPTGPWNDLNGFSFVPPGSPGTLGSVESSDFCGGPWLTATPPVTSCGGVGGVGGVQPPPSAANNWNINAEPLFVNVATPPFDFQLACGIPSPCAPPACPSCSSPCIDVLDPAPLVSVIAARFISNRCHFRP